MSGMRLSELCSLLNRHGVPARLDGEDRVVRGVNTLEGATDGEVSFLSNPKYIAAAQSTRASAILVKDNVVMPGGPVLVRCEDPYAAVTAAIIVLHGHRRHPSWGRHAGANIDPSARIGANPNIACGATIGANVAIGANCTIYPGCYIADGAVLGDDCTLFPNVVVYDHCVLGNRVTIHAGSVIGQDGLGYAPRGEKWLKIPQVGRTVLGDDVEIGANCAIDRATLGQTEIGSGTKFGNVVVVGHGTKIGPDCLFVGHVGLAGSATIGRHVTLAGQVGVAGHISIGDNVRVGAQSGVHTDVPEGQEILGSPAIPIAQSRRALYAVTQLPEWVRRVRDLEREVRELKERLPLEANKG